MHKYSLLGLCVAALAVQLAAADVSFTIGDGNRADFVDLNGQIKLYPAAEPTTFIKLKLARLEEVNATGAFQQGVTNFATQSFTWQGPELRLINGVNATAVATRKTLNAQTNTTFGITALVFHTDTTTPYGSGAVYVYRRAVKFTVHVEKWPFLSPSNKLRLVAEVLHVGGDSASTGQATAIASGETRYSFGPGSIDAQAKSINDGAMLTAPAQVTTTDSTHLMQWTFASFASTLDYDATMQIIDAEDSDLGAGNAVQPMPCAFALALGLAWMAL